MKRKPGREGLRQGLTGCIMNMFKDEKTSGFEYDRFTRTETGERLYANLRNSMDSRPVQNASVSKAVFERRYMK